MGRRGSMSSEQVSVVIAGKMNHPGFQRAKAAAESLLEFHGGQGFSCSVMSMVPAEWETYRENTARVVWAV